MKAKIFLLLLIMISINLFCEKDSLSINTLQNRLSNLENKIDQTISNQINYKVEKDLLKETYSNNYDRIQIIISIVLGLITLLGILGISSINKTKKKYETELAEFKSLRLKFEQDYDKLNEYQEATKKQFNQLSKVNQEQDVKLKILEIKEKASTYLSNKNYTSALEYVNIGISLDPNNISFLDIKADACTKLLDFDTAIEMQKLIIKEDYSNTSAILELAELYLLTKNNDDFIELRDSHKKVLFLDYENIHSILFDVLLQYNLKDIEKIKQHTIEVLSKLDDNEVKEFFKWDFAEINNAINKKNADELTNHLFYFINIVDGHWGKKQYEDQLKKSSK